ncbi:MAG: hypothetical protein R2695_16910 [Acidimicrobiales bacterium]
MTIEEMQTELRRLHAAADAAVREAAVGQELARALEQRRQILLHRLDLTYRRHVAETWSSTAATASRDVLREEVSFAVWAAGEPLRSTARELDQLAATADAVARTNQARAAVVEAELTAAMVAPAAG